MNTDLLTFFSGRESHGGTIQVLTVEIEQVADVEILVYSPEKVDLSRPIAFSVPSDKEYRALVKELNTLLTPGGGILAQLQSHNGFTRAALTVFKGPSFKPPQKMLRLSPAGSTRFEKFMEPVDVPLGDHLVVPATAEAEERLASFYKGLNWFPADLESSILNVIRRPSLEWRIERIERALNQPAATWIGQHRTQRATLLEKMHHAVMWKIPIGPAIVAALLLTAGSLAAYDKLFAGPDATSHEEEKQDEKKDKKKETKNSELDSNGSDSAETEKEDTQPRKLADSERDFSDALRNSKNNAIQKLYQTHFKNQSESFWGIAKLHALQLSLIREDDPLLGDATIPGAKMVRDLYQKSKGPLKAHQPALMLLAWSHCQQSGEGRTPMFPQTSSELRKSLPLITNLSCEDLNSEPVVSDLDALTEWVRNKN
ncbi:MAG TPA: hypothetical protein VKK31_29200 [Thermoanaerobaculia bacterium]|nr:hypothetical protein [Thermoanaerobaculia bacterium]